VAEPPHVREHDHGGQAGVRGLRGLEALSDLLVVRAGRDLVDLDPGLLGEAGEELLLHVLGAAGVAGPEVDLLGGLDAGEVDVGLLGAATAAVTADLRSAAVGESERAGAGDAEAKQGAAAEPAGEVQGTGHGRVLSGREWLTRVRQPVTLPWVRPETMCRCSIAKTMSTGAMTRTVPAMRIPQPAPVLPSELLSAVRPTGRVMRLASEVMISGQM